MQVFWQKGITNKACLYETCRSKLCANTRTPQMLYLIESQYRVCKYTLELVSMVSEKVYSSGIKALMRRGDERGARGHFERRTNRIQLLRVIPLRRA